QIETQRLVPVKRCRTISKRDMIHNDALPDIEIDPETYNVYVDGERVTVKPAKTLPLTQLFYFR
ncbi:MAG: urease subunit alpha, partial [Rhodospirillaceae bacterium]|nr:urease subunit alpha [Rhodospirillaceae bacterium]